MIARLTGRIEYRGEGHVILGVGGVGYAVFVSDRTLAALPAAGGAASLWTDLLVREDLLQLYGFLTLEEREWHRLLTSVSGVGAKASLAVLGTLGADALGRAVALGDWASVRAAPGVGPKIAQRIVNELRGKAPAMMGPGAAPLGAPSAAASGDDDAVIEDGAPAAHAPAPPVSAQAEALSALQNLGYAPQDAARAVAEAAAEGDAETPALIRAALRRLAPA